LHIEQFTSIDPSTNGLVVGSPREREVVRVAFAVDADLSTFRLAIQEGADLLFTHHGLFWGSPLAIIGTHYTRVKTLLDADLDLFVCHLPLDAHPIVGNNAQMAMLLGLEDLQSFAPFHEIPLGYWGTSNVSLSLEEIQRRLGFSHAVVLPFGKKEIRSVGLVSGAASEDVSAAIAMGLDCFVTGEVRHEQYSDCVENHMNVIGGGHYQSEVFGVQAVSKLLRERFGLQTVFLANPTGL
jgi:dinuclear metal center YbgI/SA1388 family protein